MSTIKHHSLQHIDWIIHTRLTEVSPAIEVRAHSDPAGPNQHELYDPHPRACAVRISKRRRCSPVFGREWWWGLDPSVFKASKRLEQKALTAVHARETGSVSVCVRSAGEPWTGAQSRCAPLCLSLSPLPLKERCAQWEDTGALIPHTPYHYIYIIAYVHATYNWVIYIYSKMYSILLTWYYTHTHTHTLFFMVYGDSPLGVMVFILYKLYVLLPYTYPTPKLSPHRRRCISTFPPKNSLCMIYKHFELWGH